jgi:ubiquitin-protein ligase
MRRLIADIKEANSDTLTQQGIFYRHDESQMLVGYCLIIGREDTPYSWGNYLFEFNFPTDYPSQPPIVTFMTNDGNTRFHPNLYKNGKCCLSILNTWRGEQWTSCITLTSILLNLCTLFNNTPLLHEPGINENHADNIPYYKSIVYKNIETSIIGITHQPNLFCSKTQFIVNVFQDEINKNWSDNKTKILAKTKHNNDISHVLHTMIYKMYVKINYPDLIKKIEFVV